MRVLDIWNMMERASIFYMNKPIFCNITCTHQVQRMDDSVPAAYRQFNILGMARYTIIHSRKNSLNGKNILLIGEICACKNNSNPLYSNCLCHSQAYPDIPTQI